MTELAKYPRTPHLSHSPGNTSDDKIMSRVDFGTFSSMSDFVVTEKMDGGNVTMTRNHFFARSLDSGTHSWDTPAKALWANVRHSIPEGWRVSGESLYARRSVAYGSLDDIYLVFGIWDERDVLLSWDDTVEYAAMLGLSMVPKLYRGTDITSALNVWSETLDEETSEGFVVRYAGEIPANEFNKMVAKYVRADHVRTAADWRHRDDFRTNAVAVSPRV